MGYLQIGILIVMSFLISATLTYIAIPILQNLKAGQNIREEGPKSHQVKAGTPSMGGLAIIAATIITCLTSRDFSKDMGVILVAFFLFGLLGFLDDYLKVAKRQNLGLRAWQKLVLQIIIAGAVAAYQASVSIYSTSVFIPIINQYWDFGIFYIPFVAFVVVAMVNSVNLTDGLDGLASGVTSLVALFFAIVAVMYGMNAGGAFNSALTGACMGFLMFNKNPAKVFMGDTGSLALGGGLAAAAIIMNMELMLPIVGLIYVLEALSVLIQVVSFKTTGKRVFKMAPLHHHFELCGLKETQVVGLFWLFTLICCVVGLVIL
ncbi:phospho-N-acetylmuramoyl-pentapeptide-transferase [Clostridium aminobutyricum]|uniref:Phospho-N-acetylmuramoyl-pentapeptide-transferase n=1 Tax=Clostridium aminobutyricum TaxID=33953 RepID=A0A939DBI1_CLOAM|nr:phospho-N-acetylmuramoyl-pentapeptide-transferase [Clostridium aminobutyricum]MBN7774248.1 phospho-N-acetylmuramoyl-pentapeptide-transferase [Clostridium aminobutyricum]